MPRNTVRIIHPKKMVTTSKQYDRKRRIWVLVVKEGTETIKTPLEDQEFHEKQAAYGSRIIAALKPWKCPDCGSDTSSHNEIPCGYRRN